MVSLMGNCTINIALTIQGDEVSVLTTHHYLSEKKLEGPVGSNIGLIGFRFSNESYISNSLF
jgi:hypothetical protein